MTKRVILIDTNIVIRFLTNDHPVLSKKATDLFLLGQQQKAFLYLHDIIIAEVVWILSKAYNTPRKTIGSIMERLLSHDFILHEEKHVVLQALSLYQTSSLSFPDCYLYVYADEHAYEIETFDKKLKRLKNLS